MGSSTMSTHTPRKWRSRTSPSTACALNGWAEQIDVKIAKPRNSQSPNFKAFDSIKTLTSSPAQKCTITPSAPKNRIFELIAQDKVQAPSFFSETHSFCGEKPNYFSLSKKTSEAVTKVTTTDRVENFMKRFSAQLTLDTQSKAVFDSSKKRHSMDERDVIGSRFSKNK